MRPINFDHLRQPAQISLGMLLILFMLSIVWYKFRMYFLDAPFIVFQIINDDSPAIMVGRYGAILTQIFPYIGQKFNLPMSVILLLYSMSFNLLYLVSGLILYKLKAYHWVIMLAFYQIAFATDAFFWTNNEIHQSICYLALSAGIWYFVSSYPNCRKGLLYAISSALLLVAIITHPLAIPVVAYVIGFMFIIKELNINRRRDIFLVSFSLSACIVKYFLSKTNWYDGDKLNQLSGQSLSSWLSFMDKPVAKTFLPELFQNHWSALIVIILVVTLLIRERLYLMLIWAIGFSMVYMITISMIIIEYTRFYTESQWMAVAIFISLPLMYLLQTISKSVISKITVLVFILWIFNIPESYRSFKHRYEWQRSILDKMESKGIDKLMLSNTNKEVIENLKMAWALPVESLNISAAEYKRPMTFIINQPERTKSDQKVFLSCFEDIAIKNLNQNYFPLDTTTSYSNFEYDSFFIK